MPPVASPVRGRQRRQDDLHQHQFDPFSAPASDPFAPTPAPAFAAPGQVRQSPGSDLGIDHELLLEKRARAPTVKLDEDRLLDPSALPALRERARCLKLKGKGHEFSDASRLLSFYQLWLDDIFPRANFRDALIMVEKAGHKRRLVAARDAWIDEGKPRSSSRESVQEGGQEEDQEGEQNGHPSFNDAPSASADANHSDPAPSSRTKPSWQASHLPDDDHLHMDLYTATPKSSRFVAAALDPTGDDQEDDLLAALIADAVQHDKPPPLADDQFADEEAALREMDL